MAKSPFQTLVVLSVVLVCAQPLVWAQGELDTTFGGGTGFVTTPMNPEGGISHIAVQSDNKIVAVGSDGASTTRVWAIHRYLPDGSLDSGFGSSGRVTLFGSGSQLEQATDVTIDGSGRILVAGITQMAGKYRFTVVRLAAHGSLDSSFGTGGIVQTAVAGNKKDCLSYGLALDPNNGKIILAGTAPAKKTNQLAIVRYNTNGSLDASFDGDGIRLDDVSSINESMAQGGTVVVQNDGKVVVGFSRGQFWNSDQYSSLFNSWAIARYNSNGSNDSSFGSSGKVFGAFTGLDKQNLRGIALGADGKIIAAGTYHLIGGNPYWGTLVARYNSNGTLDTSLDGDGWNVTSTAGDIANEAHCLALQGDGKIVTAGSYGGPGASAGGWLVTRFNSDGSLDSSFDGDGQVVTSAGWNALGVAIDLNGRIVVGGSALNPALSFAVARYLN